MIAFLEKLTRRKTEVALKAGGEWQALVIAVADGKEIDPDETLTALDRLGKSTDDLAKGVELLNQRRVWSALVTVGSKAEVEHPRVVRAIEAEVAAFAALEETHDQKLRPMHGRERDAFQTMSEGARARRQLIETATDPIRRATAADADAKLRALQQERQEFAAELRSKQDRHLELSAQEDRDLVAHVERLKSEIEAMQSQRSLFDARAAQFAAESEAALLKLLEPEAS